MVMIAPMDSGRELEILTIVKSMLAAVLGDWLVKYSFNYVPVTIRISHHISTSPDRQHNVYISARLREASSTR